MKGTTSAILKAAGAVTFWGASFTATKIAVSEVSPVTLLWLRFGIGITCLALLLSVNNRSFYIKWKDLRDFSILGFIGIFLHNYIQSTGLKTVGAGVSVLILASTPIAITILGRIFLSEKVTLCQLVGIIIAVSGVVTVLSGGDIPVLLSIGTGNPGELLVMGSVFTWAVFSVASKGKLRDHPPDLAMFFAMAAGWLYTSVPFVISGGFSEITLISLRGWTSIFFLGVFCSALGYFFWYDALSCLPAAKVGIFMYLSPLVGVAVATILLGEPLTLPVFIGGILILVGVSLVNLFKGDSDPVEKNT